MDARTQSLIDSLRGELREEKEVSEALFDSKQDAERILSKKILELSERTAERDQLRQQVELLLDYIDGHREQGSPTATPQKFARDRALYSAADQVRKELGE
jgi:hypothetical protein